MATDTTFTSSPLLGVAFDTKTSSTDGPLLRVGTVVPILSDKPNFQAKFAIYIKASGIIGNSLYATIDLTTISCLATSVDGGAGTAYCRNGSVAFADGDYGWLAIMRTQVFQT